MSTAGEVCKIQMKATWDFSCKISLYTDSTLVLKLPRPAFAILRSSLKPLENNASSSWNFKLPKLLSKCARTLAWFIQSRALNTNLRNWYWWVMSPQSYSSMTLLKTISWRVQSQSLPSKWGWISKTGSLLSNFASRSRLKKSNISAESLQVKLKIRATQLRLKSSTRKLSLTATKIMMKRLMSSSITLNAMLEYLEQQLRWVIFKEASISQTTSMIRHLLLKLLASASRWNSGLKLQNFIKKVS